jgi:hypothetical protein
MTITEQFPSWADAERADGITDVQDLSPDLQEEDPKRRYFIHTQKCHPQFVRACGWVNYRKPTSSFNPHWAQVQFALALLLWVAVAAIVAWMVS